MVSNLYGILKELLPPAFGHMAIKNSDFAQGMQDDHLAPAPDEPIAQDSDVSWHKVAGKRYSRLVRCVNSSIFNFTLVVLAVVLEPMQYLTRLFMGFSNQAPDYGNWPPIMN